MLDQLARVPPATNSRADDVKTEEITRTLKEILAGELARLGNNAAAPADPPPPLARVRCDPADNSVYLDGKQIVTGLTADQFQFVSAVAKSFPESISFKKIKQGKTQGKNPTRIKDAINKRVRGSLPASVLSRKSVE
jgi:hypothetical protein